MGDWTRIADFSQISSIFGINYNNMWRNPIYVDRKRDPRSRHESRRKALHHMHVLISLFRMYSHIHNVTPIFRGDRQRHWDAINPHQSNLDFVFIVVKCVTSLICKQKIYSFLCCVN